MSLKLTKAHRKLIEDAICEAYEIGHAHGMAPSMIAQGKQPKRSNDGWGSVLKMLLKKLEGRK